MLKIITIYTSLIIKLVLWLATGSKRRTVGPVARSSWRSPRQMLVHPSLWNIYIHGPLSLTLLFFPPLSDCRSCFWTSDAHATSWRSWPQTWVCILFRQHHFFAIALNSFFFLSTSDLHPGLKKDIKHILNRPGNMALVPAGVNRGVRLSLTNICIILTLLVERPVNQKGDVRQSSQKAQKESRWVCLAQLPNCQEDC